MTIKTQAFLQGYMHEKTAMWGRRVTSIVKAPGIPQTAPDPKVKPLFQDGKAKFKATQQRMPTTTLEFPAPDIMKKLENERLPDYVKHRAKGSETLTPASVNDQLLQNLPIPAADFVAEQRKNYERDSADWLGPRSDLISFDKRNRPVSLDTWPGWLGSPGTNTEERRIEGLDPEKLRKHPKGKGVPQVSRGIEQGETEAPRGPEDDGRSRDFHGYPSTPDGRAAGRYDDGVAVLGHELTHNYTGGGWPAKQTWPLSGDYLSGWEDGKLPVGTSYITNKGVEYTQGVTAGLNAMRDITGEKLNDPQQVHQLFDEIIAKPSILDSIASEHARVFRTYLYLRETNPELAEKLRNSMARDSQYLVENERVEDPTVQKA